MGHKMPEDFSRLPVEGLAARLMQHALANPALLARSSAAGELTKTAAAEVPDRLAESFPSMSLLSDPTFDVRQYLEDLVSIAVTSAQQAEQISLHARETGRKTRQAIAVVACLGVLGLIVTAASFFVEHAAANKLAQVSSEVRELREVQREEHSHLAAVMARSVDREDTAAEPQEVPPSPVAPRVQTAPSPFVQTAPSPNLWRTPIPYSEPWPTPPSPPVRQITTTRSRVVVPRFFAGLFR